MRRFFFSAIGVFLMLGYQNCAQQSFQANELESITPTQSIGTVKSAPQLRSPASVSTPSVVQPAQTAAQPASQPMTNSMTAAPPTATSALQANSSPQAPTVQNMSATLTSTGSTSPPAASSEPIWLITSFQIEYDSKMKRIGSSMWNANQGEIFEAGTRTMVKDLGRDAYYSEIVGNAWLVMDAPELSSPVRVTVIECQRDAINNCKTHIVNPNDLSWSMTSLDNTSLLHSSFMCVNTGQSVSEKRGLIDCGANGVGAFMISDKDPSRFPASVGLPTRGTLMSQNTRGYAEGQFKVIATITEKTPGLEKHSGKLGEYQVSIKNRMDIQLTTNTSSIFESYGIPLVSVNFVGPEGLNDNYTFGSVNCRAESSDGQTIEMSKRMYENRFSFNRAPASMAKGTRVKVSCSAVSFDGQSATAAFEQVKP
jgi:hypothetical protein